MIKIKIKQQHFKVLVQNDLLLTSAFKPGWRLAQESASAKCKVIPPLVGL